VFYFFSGPDFLYPHALFPRARTYVLCAREPVGSQPDPMRIPPEELPGALASFRKSLSSLLDFSFFITSDLRKDVEQRHIPGSLLKAASFLPHESEFTRINEWLLEHSRAIVQDPSGIPFRAFANGKWTVRFWGRNAEPIELFAKYTEPDLQAAVHHAPSLRLP